MCIRQMSRDWQSWFCPALQRVPMSCLKYTQTAAAGCRRRGSSVDTRTRSAPPEQAEYPVRYTANSRISQRDSQ